MVYRNSIVSPKGYLYNLAICESIAEIGTTPAWCQSGEGMIYLVKTGNDFVIAKVSGSDDTAGAWYDKFGYKINLAYDLVFSASVVGGTMAVTVNGNVVTSPTKVYSTDTVVFTATASEGYSFVHFEEGESTAIWEDNPHTLTSVSADLDVTPVFGAASGDFYGKSAAGWTEHLD